MLAAPPSETGRFAGRNRLSCKMKRAVLLGKTARFANPLTVSGLHGHALSFPFSLHFRPVSMWPGGAFLSRTAHAVRGLGACLSSTRTATGRRGSQRLT